MMRRRAQGFTLVELVVVMVVVGVLAGILVLQVRPAMQSYLAVRQRANLTSQADAALRRIVAEVHAAVPNSLRFTQDANNQCIEFVPTSDGGRFRTDIDTTPAGAFSPFNVPLVPGVPTSKFAVLTTFASAGGQKVAQPGDFVVVGNLNRDDVYAGVNVGTIQAIADSVQLADRIAATHLVTLKSAVTFPAGYEGGRFVVVPAAERAVTYTCDLRAGTVWRVTGYTPSATQPTTCPTGTTKLVARVSDCGFAYAENEGATQQSGYLQLRLGLTDGGETATLTMGAHVENVP
jgi:MSHA biogenesis protein MshO